MKKSKILNQRVKIFKSYLEILKKNRITVTDDESEVYNELNKLHLKIKNLKDNLLLDKNRLGREITQVKRIVKPLGKLREETAGRIDIIT